MSLRAGFAETDISPTYFPAERTFVVSLANGWLGYIPHKAAFDRKGGHESSWAVWSKMEESAGDIIADEILSLIEEVKK